MHMSRYFGEYLLFTDSDFMYKVEHIFAAVVPGRGLYLILTVTRYYTMYALLPILAFNSRLHFT